MQTPDSQQIVKRFFEVINILKETKHINKNDLAFNYEINRRNFWFMENNPQSGMFQIAWLMYMVQEYNVSTELLMTGRDSIFNTQ